MIDLFPLQNIESQGEGPDPADKNDTSENSDETLVDSGGGRSSAADILDGSAAERSNIASSSEISNPDASTSGTDSPFYQLRTDATKLVAQTFQRGRRNLWQLATSRLSVLLSSSAVCSTSIYQFLKNYEDLAIFILAGEAFCGFEASEFRQKLRTLCLNYVVSFHRQNIYVRQITHILFKHYCNCSHNHNLKGHAVHMVFVVFRNIFTLLFLPLVLQDP